MNRQRLIRQLRFDEGVRSKVYRDSEGIETIGVGRNLVDRGLSDDEINYLLDNDIDLVVEEANGFAWYYDLNDVRQEVVLNMLFNLGLSRFKGFKMMIAALERHDYDDASREMLDSKWAGQVGSRALRLSEAMRIGK